MDSAQAPTDNHLPQRRSSSLAPTEPQVAPSQPPPQTTEDGEPESPLSEFSSASDSPRGAPHLGGLPQLTLGAPAIAVPPPAPYHRTGDTDHNSSSSDDDNDSNSNASNASYHDILRQVEDPASDASSTMNSSAGNGRVRNSEMLKSLLASSIGAESYAPHNDHNEDDATHGLPPSRALSRIIQRLAGRDPDSRRVRDSKKQRSRKVFHARWSCSRMEESTIAAKFGGSLQSNSDRASTASASDGQLAAEPPETVFRTRYAGMRYEDDDVENEYVIFLYRGRRSFLTFSCAVICVACFTIAVVTDSFTIDWLGIVLCITGVGIFGVGMVNFLWFILAQQYSRTNESKLATSSLYEMFCIAFALVSTVVLALPFYPIASICTDKGKSTSIASFLEPCIDSIGFYNVIMQILLAAVLPVRGMFSVPIILVAPWILMIPWLHTHAGTQAVALTHLATQVLLSLAAAPIAWKCDTVSRLMFEDSLCVKADARRNFNVRRMLDRALEALLSKAVIRRLAAMQPVLDQTEFGMVMVTEAADFATWANNLLPADVVHAMNALFTSYDELTRWYGMDKVKAAGDRYVVTIGLQSTVHPSKKYEDLLDFFAAEESAAAGISCGSNSNTSALRSESPRPLTWVQRRQREMAVRVCKVGLHMLRILTLLNFKLDAPLAVRIAAHAGPLLGALVGYRSISYDVFGPTMQLALQLVSSVKEDVMHCTAPIRELYQRMFHDAAAPSFTATRPNGDVVTLSVFSVKSQRKKQTPSDNALAAQLLQMKEPMPQSDDGSIRARGDSKAANALPVVAASDTAVSTHDGPLPLTVASTDRQVPLSSGPSGASLVPAVACEVTQTTDPPSSAAAEPVSSVRQPGVQSTTVDAAAAGGGGNGDDANCHTNASSTSLRIPAADPTWRVDNSALVHTAFSDDADAFDLGIPPSAAAGIGVIRRHPVASLLEEETAKSKAGGHATHLGTSVGNEQRARSLHAAPGGGGPTPTPWSNPLVTLRGAELSLESRRSISSLRMSLPSRHEGVGAGSSLRSNSVARGMNSSSASFAQAEASLFSRDYDDIVDSTPSAAEAPMSSVSSTDSRVGFYQRLRYDVLLTMVLEDQSRADALQLVPAARVVKEEVERKRRRATASPSISSVSASVATIDHRELLADLGMVTAMDVVASMTDDAASASGGDDADQAAHRVKFGLIGLPLYFATRRHLRKMRVVRWKGIWTRFTPARLEDHFQHFLASGYRSLTAVVYLVHAVFLGWLVALAWIDVSLLPKYHATALQLLYRTPLLISSHDILAGNVHSKSRCWLPMLLVGILVSVTRLGTLLRGYATSDLLDAAIVFILMLLTIIGMVTLPDSVFNVDLQYLGLYFLMLTGAVTRYWQHALLLSCATTVTTAVCQAFQAAYGIPETMYPIMVLMSAGLAASAYFKETYGRSHFDAVCLSSALLRSSEDDVVIQKVVQRMMFPRHVLSVVQDLCLGTALPDCVFLQSISDLVTVELRLDSLSDAVLRDLDHPVAAVEFAERSFFAIETIVERANEAARKRQPRLLGVRKLVHRVHSLGDRILYAGPLDDLKESDDVDEDDSSQITLKAKSERKAFASWKHQSVSTAAFRSSKKTSLERAVNASSTKPIQAVGGLTEIDEEEEDEWIIEEKRAWECSLVVLDIVSSLHEWKQREIRRLRGSGGRGGGESTAKYVDAQQMGGVLSNVSAVVCCGPGIGTVLGSRRVSFNIFGAVARSSFTLLDASPVGFLGCTDAFKRLVRDAGVALPVFGHQLVFGVSQRWRVRGSGVVTMHPLIDAADAEKLRNALPNSDDVTGVFSAPDAADHTARLQEDVQRGLNAAAEFYRVDHLGSSSNTCSDDDESDSGDDGDADQRQSSEKQQELAARRAERRIISFDFLQTQ